MKRMWELGCTGEFGCSCPDKQAVREKQNKNLKGHGTRAKYQRGCRCFACVRENARYHREYERARAKRKKEQNV